METIHSDNEVPTSSQGSKHRYHQHKEQIRDSYDTELSEKKSNKRKGTGADKKEASSQRSHKSKKLRREKSSLSDDSSDTSSNLNDKKLFEEFLKWHQKETSRSKSRSESKSRSKKHRKDKKPTAKEVELVEKSGIIVNRFKLDLITESYRKNPREMTRKLFKLIIDIEELAKMTIAKTKGRELMPEKYLEAGSNMGRSILQMAES
ncbi:RNA-binding protein 27-like [Microplitis mediator]|uniref:RNA-binding protein 27-like n=1 Tax=Microplitis mediator TaxID=375433 RepID=UPI0025538832|nr:RNA-binding protein 27-like [Microplitis mediator]XP_057324618.1 RNA-binding protein 27-like [Microplitis mediator]XP_057324619.1 RNA-binding protein 27-like [Microplitis mediator]